MEKFRAEQIEALKQQISQTQALIERLKQKRLAILNPYIIMPKPGSEEEAQQEAKMKPKELLDQVDQEIAKAGEELADLQSRLVTIETHAQIEQAGGR